MEKVRLDIVGLSYSQTQSGSCALVLGEVNGRRRLPIVMLICFDGKKTTEIDCRTSDAVALAVRFECPIYTYEFILASAGTLTEGNESTHLEDLTTEIQSTLLQPATANLTKLSTEELQKNLEKALAQEAYEKAATIRDELDKRKLS